ncbi:MAG: biotin--[acetyl-CoA-carboxylase] ligase [Hyphomicrobiaceae bacterium]
MPETPSTNSDAMARAIAGEALPLWVMADQQTAGKGRSGRAWQSAPGNLHTSLALKVACEHNRATQLALVAGVAVIEAVRALATGHSGSNISKVRLKWPNDVMAGDAKLGGILIETTTDLGRGGLICVIGFGINVISTPRIDRKLAHLHELGLVVTAGALQHALAVAMSEALEVWNEGAGFGLIRSRWLAAGLAEGDAISVNAGSGPAGGLFAGLDDGGALLMRDPSGQVLRFTFGDVTLQSA